MGQKEFVKCFELICGTTICGVCVCVCVCMCVCLLLNSYLSSLVIISALPAIQNAIKASDVSSILIKTICANADDIADTSYLQVYGERYLCERKNYLSFRGVLVKLYDFLATKNRDILHDWLVSGARHIVVADRWMNIREGACGIALTSLEAPAACGKRAGRRG